MPFIPHAVCPSPGNSAGRGLLALSLWNDRANYNQNTLGGWVMLARYLVSRRPDRTPDKRRKVLSRFQRPYRLAGPTERRAAKLFAMQNVAFDFSCFRSSFFEYCFHWTPLQNTKWETA